MSEREKPRFVIECQHCAWSIDVGYSDNLIDFPYACQKHWENEHVPPSAQD